MRLIITIVLLLFISAPAVAIDVLVCMGEASGGYIIDPGRPVGHDKSKPQSFFPDGFPVRFGESKVQINFQGLGWEEFECSDLNADVMQCRRRLTYFVFDRKLKRFNLARLEGHVEGSKEALVVTFGECVPPVRR